MSETLIEALRRHVRESGRSIDDLEREVRSGRRVLARFVRGESSIGIDLAERLAEVLGLRLVATGSPSELADRVSSLERRVAALERGSDRPPVPPVPPPGSHRRPSHYPSHPPPGSRAEAAAAASSYTAEQAAQVKSLLQSDWASHAIEAETGVPVETIEHWRAHWQRSGELS